MHRPLTVAILALGALLGAVSGSDAQGPINVTAFPPGSGCSNAIPNDSLDDTVAFKCAITLLPASGGEIYVPAGEYRLDKTLSVTDKSVAWRGEGKRISRLVWTTGVDGLSFTSNSIGVHFTLAVRSLSLIKSGAAGGAAIRAQWKGEPNPQGVRDHTAHGVVTATIHDVHTGTDDIENFQWDYGIRLIRATTAKISAFDIQGGEEAGIQIAGRSGVDDPVCVCNHLQGIYDCKSISVRIHDGVITKADLGIETRDKVEGLHVQNVSIREADKGLELKAECDIAGLGTSVSNSYIQARSRGIDSLNGSGITVTNNLIERFGSVAFQGIHLTSSTDFRLSGNTIASDVAGGEGIVLQGASKENAIVGNTTVNMSVGIKLDGTGVTDNIIAGNVHRQTGIPIDPATPVIGSRNQYIHNH